MQMGVSLASLTWDAVESVDHSAATPEVEEQ